MKSVMRTEKDPATLIQLAAAMAALGAHSGENTEAEHAKEAERLGGGRRITSPHPLSPRGRGQGEGVRKREAVLRPSLRVKNVPASIADGNADAKQNRRGTEMPAQQPVEGVIWVAGT